MGGFNLRRPGGWSSADIEEDEELSPEQMQTELAKGPAVREAGRQFSARFNFGRGVPTGQTFPHPTARPFGSSATPTPKRDALANPQPGKKEPEESWTLKGNAAEMGPSDKELAGEAGLSYRELLRGPEDQQVKMRIGDKEYDYTGASQGLRFGNRLQGSTGSVSFADVSGETPGAERLASERRQRALSQLRDQTQLAGGQEQLRLAQMTPEQRAIEQGTMAKRESEMRLGMSEQDYVKRAGDVAAAEIAANPAFAKLNPEQQATALQRKRAAAELEAQQEYMTRIQEIYAKRFNTSPF